jgi:hypothetical protein
MFCDIIGVWVGLRGSREAVRYGSYTISRRFGGGGMGGVRRVCEALGYRYLDKLLMSQVAAEVGLPGK